MENLEAKIHQVHMVLEQIIRQTESAAGKKALDEESVSPDNQLPEGDNLQNWENVTDKEQSSEEQLQKEKAEMLINEIIGGVINFLLDQVCDKTKLGAKRSIVESDKTRVSKR